MNERSSSKVSYALLDKLDPEQAPKGPTLREVNMSAQGQRELIEIVGWLFSDPENQTNLDRGARLLDECTTLYSEGVRFDLIKDYARVASTPDDDMEGIPEIYR